MVRLRDLGAEAPNEPLEIILPKQPLCSRISYGFVDAVDAKIRDFLDGACDDNAWNATLFP